MKSIILLPDNHACSENRQLRKNLPVSQIVPILAQPFPISRDYTIPTHGLKSLTAVTATLLEDSARRTFISSQIADIELQRIEASRYVEEHLPNIDFTVKRSGYLKFFVLLIISMGSIFGGVNSTFGLSLNKKVLISFLDSLIESIKKYLFPAVLANGVFVVTHELIKSIAGVYIEFVMELKEQEIKNAVLTSDDTPLLSDDSIELCEEQLGHIFQNELQK